MDVAKQRIAWTIIAQSYFDQGDFAKAEPAFVQARELAGADDKMRADLTERLAASVYKQGEAKQKAGDTGAAVEDFLRVSRVAPDSKIRANAQYDAAARLINLKAVGSRDHVLEDFRHQFPQSQLQPEVTRKLAVAYSSANRPGEAAAEFERIAANPAEDTAVQREALMQSADLYAKAGNTPKAVRRCSRSSWPPIRRRSRMPRRRASAWPTMPTRAAMPRAATTGIARSSRPMPRRAHSAPIAPITWRRRRSWPSRSRRATRSAPCR